MRSRKSGTLVAIGTMAAWMTSPGCSLYGASKAALRWATLSLAQEVKPLGINVCLIEPGYFRTDLLKPQSDLSFPSQEARIGDYGELNKMIEDALDHVHGQQAGDPVRGAEVMYEVLTGTASSQGREVPAFIPLGGDAVEHIKGSAEESIKECEAWKEVVSRSDFPDQPAVQVENAGT